MRVSFAGASGTGKSTLAEWLAKVLGAEVNPVGSRSVALAMGLTNDKGEADPYLADVRGVRPEFQRRLMSEKRAWEDARERFVTDRTTLDNISYTILHDVRAATAEQLRSAVDGLRRYTTVFYLPASAHIKIGGQDPARAGASSAVAMSEDDARAYHDVFDALLFALLLRHRHDMIVLAHPDVESRKAVIRATLRLPAEGCNTART